MNELSFKFNGVFVKTLRFQLAGTHPKPLLKKSLLATTTWSDFMCVSCGFRRVQMIRLPHDFCALLLDALDGCADLLQCQLGRRIRSLRPNARMRALLAVPRFPKKR